MLQNEFYYSSCITDWNIHPQVTHEQIIFKLVEETKTPSLTIKLLPYFIISFLFFTKNFSNFLYSKYVVKKMEESIKNNFKFYYTKFVDYFLFDQKPMKGEPPMSKSIYNISNYHNENVEEDKLFKPELDPILENFVLRYEPEEKIKPSTSMITIDLGNSIIEERSVTDFEENEPDPLLLNWVEIS